MIAERGRVGLYVAIILVASATCAMIQHNTEALPLDVLALPGSSFLLVLARVERPRSRPRS